MKENIILVDCDGVLCDWEYAFRHWMLLEKKLNPVKPNALTELISFSHCRGICFFPRLFIETLVIQL